LAVASHRPFTPTKPSSNSYLASTSQHFIKKQLAFGIIRLINQLFRLFYLKRKNDNGARRSLWLRRSNPSLLALARFHLISKLLVLSKTQLMIISLTFLPLSSSDLHCDAGARRSLWLRRSNPSLLALARFNLMNTFLVFKDNYDNP